MKKPGASEVTGKFGTREELVRTIFTMKEKRYSQKFIANECDVAESTVSNIINGSNTVKERFDILKHKMLRGDWKNLEVHNETNSEGGGQVGQGEEAGDCTQG